ncbi:MAG: hypothetical protein R3234_14050 [Thermoanaerobaculia bacterium]|nr:hypothetical protein [Thermoanaerobaculia bacterium]
MSDPVTPHRSVFVNVGSGRSPLPGWVNVDLQLLPSVDVVADVTSGLCVRSAAAIFAEHFLEHLALDEALEFLQEAHRVLESEGWIRLSTPNLEWVLETHYDPGSPTPEGDPGTLDLNRAFYGWEHRFLWDRSLLRRALLACGFVDLRWPGYGESDLSFFQGLERHERSADYPHLPHVLVVEGRKGPPRPDRLEALQRRVEERFLEHMEEARLRRARLEIERLHRELERRQQEMEDLRSEKEQWKARHGEARLTIEWMEASRFWKARNLWFRLKRALGLVPGE